MRGPQAFFGSSVIGLGVILPGLPTIDAFFADTKHVVGLESLRAVEDSSTICHNGLWCAIAPKSISQDGQIVPLILGGGDL
jgi:hypothetical protein